MLTLDTSIREIGRIGAVTAKFFNNLDIETIEDLLFYFPFRYDDFSSSLKIDRLIPGTNANITGSIELIQNKKSFRRKMSITEALISDETGTVKAVWFNQPYLIKNLKEGDKVSLAGKIEEDYTGAFFSSPVYERLSGGQENRAVHTQGLVPYYSLTQKITQKQVRFVMNQIIHLSKKINDWLPEQIKKENKLIDLSEAIAKIHFPKNKIDIDQAKRRLAFEELFMLQLQAQTMKKEFSGLQAPKIRFFEKETRELVGSLAFKLTDAQKKAAWEILRDIDKEKPMMRLLEGDVGSGKTIVATLALLNVALNEKKAVLMVPTEILAKQHFFNLCKLLEKFDLKIGLVTRSEKNISSKNNGNKKNLTSDFVLQNSDMIIGTHALIQEKIEFNDLALAIIDEQHRFGVEQRKVLVEKAGDMSPHLLSMTATPIPRSLALAIYGDLDLSIINQMPAGRKKIMTKIVTEDKRQAAYDFIKKEISNGRQVFVICPLIDISDKLGTKSVKEEFEKLDKIIFPDLKIGILHGKMKAAEKEKTMQEFLDNKIKILVSTSVIEVGVDVPNATIMMIEGSERFGLAALHQFRGRVGRSGYQSYCFLLTESSAPQSLKRLQALVDYDDGFALAKIDLKMRGPGEVYGQLQKGFPELKIASLFDYQLMKEAKNAAEKIFEEDDSLNDWPELKKKLGEWERNIHLE